MKPGWKTSEFWLSTAAKLLTVLFASGALTNNVALQIAGIAASVLTALGYTVARTMLKATPAAQIAETIDGRLLELPASQK